MRFLKNTALCVILISIALLCVSPVFASGPPTYAVVTIPQTTYFVGESTTFYLDSDGETNTLWVYYPDGTSKYFQNVGTSISVTFDGLGEYSALVETWNGYGSYVSEKVYFRIVQEVTPDSGVMQFFADLFYGMASIFEAPPMLYLFGIFVLAFIILIFKMIRRY